MNDYKEKSNRGAIAILLILTLLLMASLCSSQVYYPVPMKFGCGQSDTLRISVKGDDYSGQYLTVTCNKHKHEDMESITIIMQDSTYLNFFSANRWWVADRDKLFSMPFIGITFNESDGYILCSKIKTKDYFIKYYQEVEK